MRLRMLARPTGTIDGVSLKVFQVGVVYEVRAQIACVFLAEGWAEVVADEGSSAAGMRSAAEDVTIPARRTAGANKTSGGG